MKTECTIIEIIDETPDVKTFRLRPKTSIDFIPGQYLLLSMNGEQRPFTFSSSPTEKEYFEITVKKMGKFTQTLHSILKGTSVTVDGPLGESLKFDETVKQDVVFIAGGSGITPFMSAIRYAVAKSLPNKSALFFSNRTEQDIIFRKELDEINKSSKTIKTIFTISDEISKDWKEESGRINQAMIEKYVKLPKKKLWYLCGPPPMIAAMKQILTDMKVPAKNLRIEEWQIRGKNDPR